MTSYIRNLDKVISRFCRAISRRRDRVTHSRTIGHERSPQRALAPRCRYSR